MNTPSFGEMHTKPLAPRSTSIQLLGAARDIQEQRARDYDQPGGERSMQATVEAFNIITRRASKGTGLTESEGWLLMQILKDVRDRSTDNPHRDSLEDAISYSSLKAESRLREAGVTQAAKAEDLIPQSPVDVKMHADLVDILSKLKLCMSGDVLRKIIKTEFGVEGFSQIPVSCYARALVVLRKQLESITVR